MRSLFDMGHLAGERLQIFTDPGLVRQARRRRDRRYNAVVIPALRCVGLLLAAVCALVHLRFFEGQGPTSGWWSMLLFFAVYAVVSWLLLFKFYREKARIHLGDLFLGLDLPVWLAAVYITGAEHSLLYFILLARVADQTNTTFLRCLTFLNLACLSYLGMFVGLHLVREVDWNLVWGQIGILYLVGFYISATAFTAQTLRRRTRQAVRVARDTIGELETRNLELAEARREAETANRIKSNFLAMVAHELRNPLNSVIGFSDLLDDPELGNETQQQYLDGIRNGVERLYVLSGDILDMSKIEAGELEVVKESVRLASVLEDSIAAFAPMASKKKLDLILEVEPDLPEVLADPGRLRQIADNLLSNAVKYTPEGGRVVVGASRAGSGAVFTVVDSGPGIKPEDQERVFEPFSRLKGRKREEGSGLGLALCLELTRLQNMEMQLESPVSDGTGSRFSVRIPL